MSDDTHPPGRDAPFSERLEYWYATIDTLLVVGAAALPVAAVIITARAVRRQYNKTATYRGVEPI